MRKSSFLFLPLMLVASVFSQTTVPHAFVAGSTAKASEVNENFQALVTAINSLSARVTALDGKTNVGPTPVGTYNVIGLIINTNSSNSGTLEYGYLSGSATFKSDGTFSLSTTGSAGEMYWKFATTSGVVTTASTSRTTTSSSLDFSGNWSVVNNQISFTNTSTGYYPRCFIAPDDGQMSCSGKSDSYEVYMIQLIRN